MPPTTALLLAHQSSADYHSLVVVTTKVSRYGLDAPNDCVEVRIAKRAGRTLINALAFRHGNLIIEEPISMRQNHGASKQGFPGPGRCDRVWRSKRRWCSDANRCVSPLLLYMDIRNRQWS